MSTDRPSQEWQKVRPPSAAGPSFLSPGFFTARIAVSASAAQFGSPSEPDCVFRESEREAKKIRRFPWGEDTIQHARANYQSFGGADYDTSPTRGYHPDWDVDPEPYTSPVGTFESGKNGYGLYDMAGNLTEYCCDRQDAAGHRLARGGNWRSEGGFCQVTDPGMNLRPPENGYDISGLRTVLPVSRP